MRTNTLSRRFNILRVTKQGDPLSSLLFNTLLEHIMGKVKPSWTKKRCGIQTGYTDNDRFFNLRFADDVILIATSRADIRKMITDLNTEAATFGLKLHTGKTKVLSNLQNHSRCGSKSVKVGINDVEIIPFEDATDYLGIRFSFFDTMTKSDTG